MGKVTRAASARVRRTYTDEFKRDAVNLVVVEGYSLRRAADAVGVSSRSLREWHEKFAPAPDASADNPTVHQLPHILQESWLLRIQTTNQHVIVSDIRCLRRIRIRHTLPVREFLKLHSDVIEVWFGTFQDSLLIKLNRPHDLKPLPGRVARISARPKKLDHSLL